MSQHLGKALTIIHRQKCRELVMHEDVAAFHAPSECHELVARGEVQRERIARRHAFAVSGMSHSAFRRALYTVPARSILRLEQELLNKMSPYRQ